MKRYLKRCLLAGVLTAQLICTLSLPVNGQTMEFQMNVGQLGQKKASFSVGDRHKWYLRMEIPENWEEVEDFSVLQTVSAALSLDTESIYVRLLKENGERILLRMEEHYTVTAGSVHVEEGVADRFCVSLTSEGKRFLSEYRDARSELMVAYTARIRTTASPGTQIIGTAQLDITDKEGKRSVYLAEKASAQTGGIHMRLASPTGEPISGGQFMLAREATQKETEDSAVWKEHLDTGEETLLVVYEKFYTTETMTGEKTDIAQTDRSGQALCYGLAYGTYYLVQMEHKRGDYLASEPLRIVINEVSHLTQKDGWKDARGNPADNTICITNTLLVMPQTGGTGTLPFTLAGSIALLGAAVLMWYSRKRVLCVS